VALDLLHSRQMTQPLGGILDQQFADEIFEAVAELYLIWELHLVIKNAIFRIALSRIMAIEGRTSHHHLVKQCSQTVIVHLE